MSDSNVSVSGGVGFVGVLTAAVVLSNCLGVHLDAVRAEQARTREAIERQTHAIETLAAAQRAATERQAEVGWRIAEELAVYNGRERARDSAAAGRQ